MKILLYGLVGIVAVLVGSAGQSSGAGEDKLTVGWVEKVRLFPGNVVVHAKVDTGADNSSLNVPKMEEFIRDGARWVRFDFTTRDGKTVTFERDVVRVAKIKRHKGKRQERIVVRLGICIGNVYREAEVNLVDRSRFKYEMLIGRSFMGDKLLVDPSKKYTRDPLCTEAPTR
jgi:hypothetical protein